MSIVEVNVIQRDVKPFSRRSMVRFEVLQKERGLSGASCAKNAD